MHVINHMQGCDQFLQYTMLGIGVYHRGNFYRKTSRKSLKQVEEKKD